MAKMSNTSGTAAAAPVVEETIRTETGAALHVEGLGEAAVALGEAVAVGNGGPGVGAVQLVEEAPGFAASTTKVEEAAGIERGTYLGDVKRHGHLGDHLGTFPRAEPVVIARKPGRHDILPLSGPAIDPETVPGTKIATVAAQMRRNGRSYVPGEPVEIDFRAHSELVPIGSIVATPWHELPDAGDD